MKIHIKHFRKGLTALVAVCAFSLGALTIMTPRVAADDLPVIYRSGTLPTSETWTAGNVYYIDSLTVPSGATLTIQAGSIIKVGGTGINVSAGATLNVNGTSTNQVLFTCHSDDSAGGDSDEDGPRTPMPSEFSSAITPNGGDVNVGYAQFKYGSFAINDINIGHNPAAVSISDSEFNTVGGVRTYYPISLQRNHFAVGDSGAISIMYASDITGLVLSGANKNTFSGTGTQLAVNLYRSTIPANETWSIEAGPVIVPGHSLTVRGTLNVNEGTVIKMSDGTNAIDVANGGQLIVEGSSNSPVTITSSADDTIFGDSTGDGAHVPFVGNYQNAVTAEQGSSVSIAYANIEYANNALELNGNAETNNVNISNVNTAIRTYDMDGDFRATNIHDVETGISVQSSSKLTYRGTITNASYKAIASCKWSQNCNVDAAYTNWGSSNGPFLSNGNAVVCGRVTVSPWTSGGSSANDMFSIKNCDNSPTPSEQLSASIQTYQQAVNNSKIQCDNGFQDACQQISRTFACVDAAIGLATTNAPFPLPSSSASESAATYAGDMVSASSTYINGIEEASPAAFSASVMGGVASVLGIFTGLINAYNSCT